jgi:hypothetical protein
MDDGFRTGVSAVQFEWFLPPFFYSLVVFHLLHWVIWGFGVLEITVFVGRLPKGYKQGENMR